MIYTTTGAVLVGLLFANSGEDADKMITNWNLTFFNIIFLMFTSIMTTSLSFYKNMAVIREEQKKSFFPKINIFYLIFTCLDLLVQVRAQN